MLAGRVRGEGIHNMGEVDAVDLVDDFHKSTRGSRESFWVISDFMKHEGPDRGRERAVARQDPNDCRSEMVSLG